MKEEIRILEIVVKPKLIDFIKELDITSENGNKAGAIDFLEYAFALEKYVRYLERKLKEVDKRKGVE